MFSLAHLSDPHLALPAGGVPILGLTGKQVLALLAWHRKRRHITNPAVLRALACDLAAHSPDHIAVTGDLINLGWHGEFAAAGDWLATLGPADRVSVVPGNHDCTRGAALGGGRLAAWSAWMGGDDDAAGARLDFPFLRRRGPVAIVGLCSGVPTPLLSAAGRLGDAQRARAAALLDLAAGEGLFRVVLIHHPPVIAEGGRRRALRDRAALATILRDHGAELVLHGHHHRSRLAALPGPRGRIPIVGVPSASAGAARPEPGGWNLHRIERAGAGWRLTTIARRYDIASAGFAQAGTWSMAIGGQ